MTMSRWGKGWVAACALGLVLAWWRRLRRQELPPNPGKGLRLAFVAQEVHRSAGPAGYVAELVEHFSPEHQVTVFSSEIEEGLRPQVRHYKVPRLPGSRLLGYLSFTLANSLMIWVQRLRGNEFDIIHTNGVDSPLLGDVFTCHFCERAGLEMEEQGLGRLPATTWRQRLRSWDYHWYRHLLAGVERLVMGRHGQRRLIAVSGQVRNDLVSQYGENALGVAVIPNGVDLARFNPQNRARFRRQVRRELGLGAEDILLLFVGYDWERKGLPQLLAALALLEGEKAHLAVVGRGDVAHYATMAEPLGVASRVIFTGPSSQVERYYAAADIFALPTLYEPFGLVIVEAMASGLPVVTSRQAGAADCITPGKSGLLLDDPADPREVAAKLTQLIGQSRLRQRMGRAARKAVEGLSWDEVARRVLDIYYQVVAEREAAAEGSLAEGYA